MGLFASLLITSSSSRPPWEGDFIIGKIRPQIFMALFMLSLITGYAIFADMVEIATGTVGGLVALGMKVLEND